MSDLFEAPLLLFLALFALYSPLAALSSYFPVVGRLSNPDQTRLALGLFLNVAIFSLVAIWVGEPLLELLGLSPAALTVTGGIALMYEGVPLMRGVAHGPAPVEETVVPTAGTGAPTDPPGTPADANAQDATTATTAVRSETWRQYLFVPVTFPLTVGGTTFAFFVAFRAQAEGTAEVLALSIAGLAYAAVTGITVYAAGHVHRRASTSTQSLLERLAGILLTAIAVTILVSGGTSLVVEVLEGLGR